MKRLLDRRRIARGIAALARRIDRHYAGQPLTLLALLNGGLVFLADLGRRLTIPVEYETLRVSSYRGASTSPGRVVIEAEIPSCVADRHVLLIDDIFDTGGTLAAVAERVQRRGALSVRSAVLLWKSSRSQPGRRPDEFVFEIPDEFVVGFGLDYNAQYRQLAEVMTLEPADFAQSPNSRPGRGL